MFTHPVGAIVISLQQRVSPHRVEANADNDHNPIWANDRTDQPVVFTARGFVARPSALVDVRLCGIIPCSVMQVSAIASLIRSRVFGETGNGAARGIRTPDPLITNEVLYQLSYCGDAGPIYAPPRGKARRPATSSCEVARLGVSWRSLAYLGAMKSRI